MDSARDAVQHLNVQLGQRVRVVYRLLGNVTDGSLLHNVLDKKPLYGLITRTRTRAIAAANKLDMAAAMAVFSSVATLLGLFSNNNNIINLCLCVMAITIYIYKKKLERKRMRKVCKRGLAKRSKKKLFVHACGWVREEKEKNQKPAMD